ncbi:sulfatase family protein [Tichowtungia aerotolerans]|uniref:Sulfatase-like hydrolase/transferase n=1 Tax=Tichowtungia aerotolerans TaxID=2697043 RepID=A0A6P1MAP1_9BACT|nr:sulfatase [Tichowtungia aerotolerans]QHI69168.1 sulfatase-like hydrolase/transferase [Tichowtungia aerotolerans]
MPNILLITADDMGTTAGCYGDKLAATPNLDQLAAEGVLFENAYVTHASCSPSRSSILTGLYPHQNGHIGLAGLHPEYKLHPDIRTLPAILKDAGYHTGILGKLHVSAAPGQAPFDFEWASHGNPVVTRDVRMVAQKAEEFLGQVGKRPFFLYVNYFDPHRPYDAESNQCKGLPEKPYGPNDIEPFAYLGLDGLPVRQEVASYYNCVNRLDVGLGMLFQTLEKAGMLDDTLIIFLGDHGVPFSRAKTTCYEAGEQVPFFVKWPGVSRAGLRCTDFISSVDIMPTLLDAAGIACPPVAGRSLREVVTGSTPNDWRKELCSEYTSHAQQHLYPRRSVRNERYKLVHNLDSSRKNPVPYIGATRPKPGVVEIKPGMEAAYRTTEAPPEFELYDLSKDPHETVNIVGNPEVAEVLKRLKADLLKWRRNTADPLLDPAELQRLKKAHGL